MTIELENQIINQIHSQYKVEWLNDLRSTVHLSHNEMYNHAIDKVVEYGRTSNKFTASDVYSALKHKI